MKHNSDNHGSTAVLERPGKTNADMQAMQQKMEAAGKPGPAHKAFEPLVGEWQAEVKFWMDPDGAPQITKGTAKAHLIFGGRFLDEEFHGEMMGKPFVGRTLLGFDNVKQTFNSVWISDSQTATFTSEGKGENGNKVITLQGKSSCPGSERKDVPVKSVLRVLDQNKHVFEMFNDGVKSLEITYTRK